MMDKRYDAKASEAKWYPFWEKNGFFGADPAAGGKPYSVVIPPPNVTGILHMGHALNETIQDILVRWHRMRGDNTLWIPGTDHAGIATQNVVEKALRKEGVRRQDLGREKFVERVWDWKRQYGGTIVHQQRMLGNSSDWSRERFTFDEGCSKAVAKVFCDLYNEGLVYRGNYIVNWCPRCGTALADDETEHEPNHGHLWYIRYPVKDSALGVKGEPYKDYVMVATTRPETLPGDTAVAVNPKDERYSHLVGKTVILPISGREIPVVADDYVEREFGTGIVKITPAHDPNDFLVGKRHGLPEINVMNGDGSMNESAGRYNGLDRFQCREEIVKDLEEGGFLDRVEDYDNQVGHCYRCHSVVESRLSKQWFVKMAPLAKPAIEAVRTGEIKFFPKRWENIYFNWMENIHDWCISRQLWWGHRIPVYTCQTCGKTFASPETPQCCPDCGAPADCLEQDPDVLDTWFSSWLWPFSTLGWPEKTRDLSFYYPTTDLVTAPDIIFFWVARMIMAGYHFMGKPPFKNIVIHGIVRDDQGRKMSKSLGNSLDPLELVDAYSADALRFSLALITSLEVDTRVNKSKFEIGRNFATKIWNAARFMQMNAEKVPGFSFAAFAGETALEKALSGASLSADDRHLLAAADRACRTIGDCLAKYRIQDGALAVYDFFWTQICDWYVEYAKDYFNGDDEERRRTVLSVLASAYWQALRLLHPYMPFVTEEIAHQLGYLPEGDSIMRAPFPEGFADVLKAAWGLSEDVSEYVEAKRETITAGRALRAEYRIAPSKAVKFLIAAKDASAAERLRADIKPLETALRAESIEISTDGGERAMPGSLTRLGTIYMPLDGLVDKAAELKRTTAELEKARGFLKGVKAKLANANFTANAPAEIVENQRLKEAELEAQIGKLEKLAVLFS